MGTRSDPADGEEPMSVSLAHLNAMLVSMSSAVTRLDQGLPITVANPRSGETAAVEPGGEAQQAAHSDQGSGLGSTAAPPSPGATQPQGARQRRTRLLRCRSAAGDARGWLGGHRGGN